MASIDQVREMSAEMARLAGLTGNCGRVIDRFLSRVVDAGEIEVRIEPPKSWALLDLACFVVYANKCLSARANVGGDEMGEGPYASALTVFPWVSTGWVSIIMAVGTAETVAGRQMMLKGASQALDTLIDCLEGVLGEDSSALLRGMFVGDDCEVASEGLAVFDEVVRGVYTRVEAMPKRMIALANVLNSQVESVAPEGVDMKIDFIEFQDDVAAVAS